MKQQTIQVAVDIVVFTVHEQTLRVLLIERGIDPFKGLYALPGGFVLAEETLEQAAFRELFEETGTKNVYLEQLYSFGDPGRDPRGRVVTVAYYALVPTDNRRCWLGQMQRRPGGTRFRSAAARVRSQEDCGVCGRPAAEQTGVHQCRLSVASSKVHAERAASAPRGDPGKTTRQEKLPAEGFGARPRQAFKRDASYGAQTRPTLLLPTHNMSGSNTGNGGLSLGGNSNCERPRCASLFWRSPVSGVVAIAGMRN